MHKALVWVHGCSLQAFGWEEMVIGTGDKLGRATYGLRLALEIEAAFLVFGTGASVYGGEVESEFTYHKLGKWLDTEAALQAFELSATMLHGAKELYKQALINTVSKNTIEEVREAVSLCRTYGCDTLWLVSSPAHIARCLNEALKVEHDGIRIHAAPSETHVGNFTPEHTVIVEYPHRGDDTSPYMGSHVKRMFNVPATKRSHMLHELDELLSSFTIS